MRFDPSLERRQLPGYGAYRTDEDEDIPDPFDAAIDRGVSGALGSDMEFSPDEADAFDASPDMAFSVDEVPGYSPDLNAAYQTATDAARTELAGPAAAPVPGYASQNAPAPAVAGAQPAMAPPMVPPSSQQAATPTGAGALPFTDAARLAGRGVGAAAPPPAPPGYQGSLAGLWNPEAQRPQQQPQAPSPVQPAPGPERQAKNRAGITTGSQDDRRRMAEAEHRDRVLRGVSGGLRGLGMLLAGIGAGTGNMGLAGLGAGVGGVGGAVPAGGAVERERQRQADRLEREAMAVQAQQRDAQLGTDAERVGVQRLGAEADAVRAQAGLLGEQSEAELREIQGANMAAERAAREGSVDGYREALRARIAAMPRTNPSRQAMIEYARRGGELDSIADMQALQNLMARVERLDVRRGSSSGAGGAAGGRSRTGWDPNANGGRGGYVEVSGGGQRRAVPQEAGDPFAPMAAPQQPAAVEPPSDVVDPFAPATVAAPVEAPAPVQSRGRQRPAARARQPQPTAAPVATPAAVPSAAPAVGVEAVDTSITARTQRFYEDLRAEGFDEQSARNAAETVNAQLSSGRDSDAAEATRVIREHALAAGEARSQGLPPGTTSQQWNVVRTRLSPIVQRVRDHGGLLQRMERMQRDNPTAFREALSAAGTGRTVLSEDAAPGAQEMTEYLVPRLSQMAGANVTPEERERVTQAMGLGWAAAINNPAGFIGGLRRMVDREQAEARGASTGLPPQAIAQAYADVMGRPGHPSSTREYWIRRLHLGGN